MSGEAGDIRHESRERDGAFFVERDGRRVAELTYHMMGADAMVDHTWVDPKLRGKGDAARLVEAAVQWARREHVKLVPACSYVRAVFARKPEYADVRK
ncbi:MAG: GNAT family N-acetyltransferase [Usitatibacter sp.]